jgi:adenylate cyclase
MAEVERKLTTILVADVAGYSALMDRDETGTLARLKQYRTALAGLVERHRGRVVNTWGDGVIAEFPSVVGAVTCATEVQRELAQRNRGLGPDQLMALRIGINLGDVMVEGGDLYGEGVNVAARLQALADPGGIVISGTAHDQVRNKLVVGFDFLGSQHVKNIDEPVPAWRVALDGSRPSPRHGVALPRGGGPGGGWPPVVKRMALLAIVLVGLFLIDLMDGDGINWVQWPALGILLAAALLWVRSR